MNILQVISVETELFHIYTVLFSCIAVHRDDVFILPLELANVTEAYAGPPHKVGHGRHSQWEETFMKMFSAYVLPQN